MKKILVLEDDEDISELLDLILTDAGYEIVKSNKPNPLEALLELKVNLLLLDLKLSDAPGDEYCNLLKGHPKTRHIPVIIVSAAFGLKEIAGHLCADAYLEKPFDIVALEEKVKALIS